jgi:hypothetical protein
MQIGSHEVQVVITITLLIATSAAALLCDYLRFRTQDGSAQAQRTPQPLRTSVGHTLVPEFEVAATTPKSTRASRLAAALQQPRRAVSPVVQAIIARSSQYETTAAAPKKPTASQKKAKARRAS